MEKWQHEYQECKRGDTHRNEDGKIVKHPHCGWCGGRKKDHIINKHKKK